MFVSLSFLSVTKSCERLCPTLFNTFISNDGSPCDALEYLRSCQVKDLGRFFPYLAGADWCRYHDCNVYTERCRYPHSVEPLEHRCCVSPSFVDVLDVLLHLAVVYSDGKGLLLAKLHALDHIIAHVQLVAISWYLNSLSTFYWSGTANAPHLTTAFSQQGKLPRGSRERDRMQPCLTLSQLPMSKASSQPKLLSMKLAEFPYRSSDVVFCRPWQCAKATTIIDQCNQKS